MAQNIWMRHLMCRSTSHVLSSISFLCARRLTCNEFVSCSVCFIQPRFVQTSQCPDYNCAEATVTNSPRIRWWIPPSHPANWRRYYCCLCLGSLFPASHSSTTLVSFIFDSRELSFVVCYMPAKVCEDQVSKLNAKQSSSICVASEPTRLHSTPRVRNWWWVSWQPSVVEDFSSACFIHEAASGSKQPAFLWCCPAKTG